jgi:prepilin-type N-terminal cleavage/methylation domain-containing protein
MKNNKGFTLMEILTVIVIIAVLMGVAFPQYRRVVQKSYGTQAITMLRSLYDSSERLAMQKGYKSYSNLGVTNGKLSQMDLFADPPYGCSGNDSTNVVDCSSSSNDGLRSFKYKVKADYIVAQKQGSPAAGALLVFNRSDQQIYCVGSGTTNEDKEKVCDMYGFSKHPSASFSF